MRMNLDIFAIRHRAARVVGDSSASKNGHLNMRAFFTAFGRAARLGHARARLPTSGPARALNRRKDTGRSRRLLDGIGAVLIAVAVLLALSPLLLSPWAFDFTAMERAAWSAWGGAALMAACGAALSVDDPPWAVWGTLAVGLAFAAMPILLDFTSDLGALLSHAAAGGIAIVCGIVMLRQGGGPRPPVISSGDHQAEG